MRKEIDYQDGSYRALLGEPAGGREHALSQDPKRLAQLFLAADIRDEKVLDVGAGDCAYADMVSEFACLYAVVDPAEHFADQLGKYAWFKTIEEAAGAFGPEFDRIVIWDVIEHVPDPVGFINTCKRLLTPGGKISGCTPNLVNRYWLTECKPYLEYFYRIQHPWYFCDLSIKTLFNKCDMSISNIWTEQRMTQAQMGKIMPMAQVNLLDNVARMTGDDCNDTLFFEGVNSGKLH